LRGDIDCRPLSPPWHPCCPTGPCHPYLPDRQRGQGTATNAPATSGSRNSGSARLRTTSSRPKDTRFRRWCTAEQRAFSSMVAAVGNSPPRVCIGHGFASRLACGGGTSDHDSADRADAIGVILGAAAQTLLVYSLIFLRNARKRRGAVSLDLLCGPCRSVPRTTGNSPLAYYGNGPRSAFCSMLPAALGAHS
jgi:hypothetical protein